MKNELLRHMVATIKYRFDKSIAGSGKNFGEFSLGNGSRSPNAIIAHMNDVIYSTRYFLENEAFPTETIKEEEPTKGSSRFIEELDKIQEILKSKSLPINYAKRLVQGPLSDVLTHIGQIAMLQRLNNNPIQAEDFSRSDIKTSD